ncbi:hypothetical protein MYMA111404_00240 [Mycoplasma marinum]
MLFNIIGIFEELEIKSNKLGYLSQSEGFVGWNTLQLGCNCLANGG